MKTRSKRNSHNHTLKMNCHPNNKDPLHADTCYTKDALVQIRDSYNKSQHPKITASKPTTIYKKLREKLTQCEKEDCWMDQIQDKNVKYELDRLLFAPDSPGDWKKNPTSWLSNYDIRDVLRQYETAHSDFKLLGPSSIDYDTVLSDGKCVWNDLCRLSLRDLHARNKRKLGVVFNLDKHYEPGSHWISVYIDSNESKIIYYDSAVNPCPKEVDRLIAEICKQGAALDIPIKYDVVKNGYSHQSTNTECGMYSLFFIITMLTSKLHKRVLNEIHGGGGVNKLFKHTKLSMQDKIKLFTEPGLNDNMMKMFRKIYFN